MLTIWQSTRRINRTLKALAQERKQGQILVLYALSMFVLLGMAALALDVSFALNQKREYQKVAAVCAVVGAQGFPTPVPSSGSAPTPTINPAPAIATAQACVAQNAPNVTPTVNVPPLSGNHQDSKFLELYVSRPTDTFFGKVVGVYSLGAVGRAVAGGFLPADFAIMSLQGNIDSTSSAGGASAEVDGNACTRGQFKVNGNFEVHGQSVANQGFDGSLPNSDAGNVTGGENCTDPNYALPSPLPQYTAPPTIAGAGNRTQCVLPASGSGSNDCNSLTTADVIACPSSGSQSITDPTHIYHTVYIRCDNSNTTIQVYDRRSRVLIHPANSAKVELLGASPSNTAPAIFQMVMTCERPNPSISTTYSTATDCQAGGMDSTSQLILWPGYYDRVDMRRLGTNSPPACGSYTAKVCFKQGLYLMSTGFIGNNGTAVASNTSGPVASGGGVSIVVGTTFAPKGNNGGGGSLNLDCCASEMRNYILLYHLGGCKQPYSNASQNPPYAGDPRVVFPTWPNGWTCADPTEFWRNELNLQGNNEVQTYNGSIYSPYQCSSSPFPPGNLNFPMPCADGTASFPNGTWSSPGDGTRLPQFACGYTGNESACIKIAGGGTTIAGQLIAPSIEFKGNGAHISPPSGLNALGQQPYLAE